MAKKISSKSDAGKGPVQKRESAPPARKPSSDARPPKVSRPAGPESAEEPPRLAKSPLSKAELREFREMLLAKRRGIIGDMNHIESEALRTNRQEGAGDLSNMPTHPADIGTDNYEQEFTLGLLESERVLLREINEALERVENNTYGICMGTGQPISKPRLQARPWSKYSIEYARMLEKGLVRPAEPERSFREETAEESAVDSGEAGEGGESTESAESIEDDED